MEKELDLYTATLDEIVFEDRNKSYGGYFLRVWYEKNVTKAVIFTCATFVVIAASINFYYNITAKPTEVLVPVDIKMDLAEEPIKEEEMKKMPPPPPKIEQPKIETVKFLPPVIKPDHTVKNEEQFKDDSILLNTTVATKDQEGDKVKNFNFDEGDDQGQIGGTGVEKTEEVFTFAQEMPRFKGTSTNEESDKARMAFIQKRMIYPDDAKARKIQGIVYVKFTVGKDGKVTDVQVVPGRGLDPSCDAEAVRVIKSMPDFTPARQNGEARKVSLTAKIKFSLTE